MIDLIQHKCNCMSCLMTDVFLNFAIIYQPSNIIITYIRLFGYLRITLTNKYVINIRNISNN